LDIAKLPVNKLGRIQAKQELDRLAQEISKHNLAYYVKNAPIVTDAEYDALKKRNDDIEKRFTEIKSRDLFVRVFSPADKVGAPAAAGFGKIRHEVPMLSLDNAFAESDVREFGESLRRFLNMGSQDAIAFSAEPKIDGLSISLLYEDGKFVRGATRGDGEEGEDVSANLRTIGEIPTQLAGRAPARIEVRGEIYMTKADFLALNARQAAAEEKTFANRDPCASSTRA
jgi:DNA ligase (NAD+)